MTPEHSRVSRRLDSSHASRPAMTPHINSSSCPLQEGYSPSTPKYRASEEYTSQPKHPPAIAAASGKPSRSASNGDEQEEDGWDDAPEHAYQEPIHILDATAIDGQPADGQQRNPGQGRQVPAKTRTLPRDEIDTDNDDGGNHRLEQNQHASLIAPSPHDPIIATGDTMLPFSPPPMTGHAAWTGAGQMGSWCESHVVACCGSRSSAACLMSSCGEMPSVRARRERATYSSRVKRILRIAPGLPMVRPGVVVDQSQLSGFMS